MNLKSLTSSVLWEKTKAAATGEKQATLALLDLLAEVDARRLYSARGYATLWEFVHKGLEYSEAQASERVSAMRLMRKVPELREELVTNRVTLTSTAKLASFVRRENCGAEQTRSLLAKISKKPTREVERILLAEQATPYARPDRFQLTGPATTRISFDADAEFMAIFEELRNAQGRPDWSTADRLKSAMKEVVERRKRTAAVRPERMRRIAPAREIVGAEEVPPVLARKLKKIRVAYLNSRPPDQTTLPSEQTSQVLRAPEAKMNESSRFISVVTRRRIHMRAENRCEFVDSLSERRCESRFALQFDHILPHAKGGKTDYENLRLLCANHNRFEAIREFGPIKMAAHFRAKDRVIVDPR